MQDFEFKQRDLDLREQELEEKRRGNMATENITRDANQVKREDSKIKKDIAKKNANKRS